MTLTPGTRLGPYEITGAIGAGGMGQVYRARDTRLDRFIAIKVSADRFSDRFEREARAVAALNHPNICALYDVGPNYLVMELVEGRTLAELPRPVDPPMALAIARQMAEAIEAAHERGIVHRDLKPANIKITPDGVVKILDFGLAKALEVERGAEGGPPASADAANSPTMTSPAMTEFGMILGTAAYMSPEQARGRPADTRTDIWAFGVVLYELLAGRPLFAGETVSDTMAAVIKDELPLDRLPPATPRSVRRLIARCLERDPKLRLRDIGEARIVLSTPQPEDAAPSASPGGAARSRARLAIALAGVVAMAALAAAAGWFARSSPDPPLRRFVLSDTFDNGPSFALSPDGSTLAYISGGHLYVRALDALEPTDLGEVHVTSRRPFWSPDGGTIGFVMRGAVLRIPAAGGPVIEVCAVPATGDVLGAAWRPDGTIVFAVWRDGLYSVPASGGTPSVLLAVDPATEIDFHGVDALPDGRLLLVTHLRDGDAAFRTEIAAGGSNGMRTVIIADRAVDAARYDPRGFVIFRRMGTNAGIWAAPFTEGPIDGSTSTLIQAGATAFDNSRDGSILVRLPPVPGGQELVWLDRTGAVTRVAGAVFGSAPQPVTSRPVLSPDGRRAALIVPSESGWALVLRDLHTGADLRITHGDRTPGLTRGVMPQPPSWSPSGDEILFTTGTIEARELVARRTDGSGRERSIAPGVSGRISPDARFVVFVVDDRGHRRLRYAPIAADGSIGPAAPLLGDADPNVANEFDVSPDGRFLAYGVVEPDGRVNIFLTTFPGGEGRWQVTSEGGTRPRFGPGGTELFFVTGTREAVRLRGFLAAMPLTPGPSVTLGVPVMLFDTGTAPFNAGVDLTTYDVAPDGRFLMRRSVASDAPATPRHVLIQNWRR